MLVDLKGKLIVAGIAILAFIIYSKYIWELSSDKTETAIELKYEKSLKENNDKILKLKSELATDRQTSLTENEKLNVEYKDKLNEQKINYESIISNLDSDVISLRVNLQNTTESNKARTVIPADTSSCNNGTRQPELPKATARFLIGQANRADEVVEQLTACQDTIKLYLDVVKKHNELIKEIDNGT